MNKVVWPLLLLFLTGATVAEAQQLNVSRIGVILVTAVGPFVFTLISTYALVEPCDWLGTQGSTSLAATLRDPFKIGVEGRKISAVDAGPDGIIGGLPAPDGTDQERAPLARKCNLFRTGVARIAPHR